MCCFLGCVSFTLVCFFLKSFPAPLPYLPCEDQFIQQWVNLPETQAALHVQPNTTQGGWSDCVIDKRWNYDYSGFYNSQLPVYTRALAAGLKVVTYSGTADTVVPYLVTTAICLVCVFVLTFSRLCSRARRDGSLIS